MTPLAEGKWCPCPSCHVLHVQIRDDDPDEEEITCPACYAVFRVGAARGHRRPAAPPVPAWAPSKMHACVWACCSCAVAVLVVPFGFALLVAFLTELFRRLM
jgi:hypothetical protein